MASVAEPVVKPALDGKGARSSSSTIVPLYTSGEYLQRNPQWHVEESPWKAKHILRMLRKNSLSPKFICDFGCGAGEVLKQLQDQMGSSCRFVGYDISPDAIALSRTRANEMLEFKLA